VRRLRILNGVTEGMEAPWIRTKEEDISKPIHGQMLVSRDMGNSRTVQGAGDPRAGYDVADDRQVYKRRDGVREGKYQRVSIPDGGVSQGKGDPSTVRGQKLTRTTRKSKLLDLKDRIWGADFSSMQSGKRNTALDSTLTRTGTGEVLV